MLTAHGNIIAAVDIETTGPIVGQHEIFQISILPLNNRLEPDKELRFLNLFIKPEAKDFKAGDLTGKRERFIQARLHGLERHVAFEMLDKWADSLGIRKAGLLRDMKVMPLSFNWAWKRAFLVDFMTLDFFNDLFHWHSREIITAAVFCNDRAEFRGDPEPFNKVTLSALSRALESKNPFPDDPAFDVQHFAELWRAMCIFPLGEIR
jgi:hypothetical protein